MKRIWATETQLEERWLTPEGKKVREKIIENIREDNWERFLVGFPFVEEIKNGRDLRFINLRGANLRGANLNKAHFEGADLAEADFERANLMDADFRRAVLWKAVIWEANLVRANLNKAHLGGANLVGANLREAKLVGAFLGRANLARASLRRADLSGANLVRVDLWRASFKGANLRRINLSSCHLISADISGADLTDAYIYGISTWDIKTDKKTIMKNLTIRKNPLITVDDIEIAQFIYLLLNNEKIRNMIDTMRTKGVLILGSFYDYKKNKLTPKNVLDKIKKELQKKNYVPIVFDFNPSKKLDLISTVKALALLSSFIIIDLSILGGQLVEIGNLVRELPIPFIPIASNETEHITSMVSKKALGNYHWFKKDIIYYLIDDFDKQLPKVIESKIIPWVKNKNRKLEKERED